MAIRQEEPVLLDFGGTWKAYERNETETSPIPTGFVSEKVLLVLVLLLVFWVSCCCFFNTFFWFCEFLFELDL